MAGLIRTFDWAATPLGPITNWPQSLKTIVNLMLGSSSMMSLLWGVEAIHLYNDSFTALLREHGVQALGRSAFETFPRSRDVFAADVAAGMAGRSARLVSQRYPVLRNGHLQDAWFDVEYAPVHDDSGSVAGVLWTLKETTAQHLAEHALRGSEERHRLLVESWAQAVWETDADGVVTVDSPSWRAYTGQTLEEWRGYGWLNAIHPDDRAYAERQWREAIAARNLVNAEFRLRAPDGGWRWTNVRAAPARNAEGGIERWVGLNIDIDVRQRAEAALRASETRFRTLADTAPALIWRNDETGKNLFINQHFLDFAGKSAEAIRGEGWHTLVHPDEVGNYVADYLAAVRDRRAWQNRYRIRRYDGQWRWFENYAQPLFAEDGRYLGHVGVSMDITANVGAEAAMRESQKRQAFLLKLSDKLRLLDDPRDIADTACRLLVDTLGGSRAQYTVMIDDAPGAEVAEVLGEYVHSGMPLVRRFPMNAFGIALVDLLRSGRTLTLTDIETDTRITEDQRGMHRIANSPAAVIVPRVKDGRLVIALTVHNPRPRQWTADEIGLVEEVAQRTWAAVERARAEMRLREGEARLRQFGEASSDVLWIRDAETLQWIYLTPAFETIYGLDRETALRNDNMAGWLELIVPDDRQHALDAMTRVRAGERVTFEYRIRQLGSGTVRWLRDTDFPMQNAAGQVRWLGGVGRDITAEKVAIQHQEVLVNELQHRARNLLGVVTAVAGRTVKRGGSVEDFEERLQALSRAQALLSQAGSDTVEVGALVRAELAAYANGASDRVTVAGPEVHLRARQVQNFALAVHELTTNAVKYGALKVETAELHVTWAVVLDRRERRRLALSWVEGGVAIDPEATSRRGYGTELIQEALAYAMEAEVDYAVGPDGVRCRIEMPLT
ncbi:PAS domain S-box protein [Methylobacterium sp. E-005]|uniref:PAS domain S-box protein n=1 Tax=Methylobacterium sp. E-005 TaxID=2836549 RepID=UPI001FBA902E|nr:PAS domain S-box protein [Methylobacterium sp. E-005]MCJ2084733.1 PAS domain S-box protein [Methylobacterium sp. E-005]